MSAQLALIKRSIGAKEQKSDNASVDPPFLPDLIWALNHSAYPLQEAVGDVVTRDHKAIFERDSFIFVA